jgi:hypothetical protein
MEQMLKEDETRYAVKCNGQIVSPPYPTVALAENAMTMLSEVHQSVAEIIPVTADGKEILFG